MPVSRRRIPLRPRAFLGIPILAEYLVVLAIAATSAAGTGLPARLSDGEFWNLVNDLSEQNGSFRSDNLLSNEARFQFVIPELLEATRSGRAYLGVGPEQNFTYIAAVKPRVAFIIDIRRGNLDLHLMYKALFELSADRADFVSRLFSRKRPPVLRAAPTAAQLFSAYLQAEASRELYERNLHDIEQQLVTKHGFPLTSEDLRGIEYVYNAFFIYGPGIQYSSTEGFGASSQPTYVDLMLATDGSGRARGYLSSDELYVYVRDLQTRNLVVPVVGNFAGPKAIRAVGAYLKQRDTTVSAFYLSNVEQYLRLQRVWNTFCANVAVLPLDETSTFIRAGHGGRIARGTALTAELGSIAAEVEGCGLR
ncbi:MAG: hypothetical protein C5B57_09725 [Blastocatellia bacterium]|nr:MAG: hypothetical protein C5B57_09725 [Blastocatellia bacterium]